MTVVLLLSLLIAVVNVVDIFTDVLAVIVAKVSAFQLGLLNSLSYVFYIVALYAGSRLSDRGIIKLQVFLVLTCLASYVTLLGIFVHAPGIPALAVMYLLYSSAQALAKTATLTYIHEMHPSTSWNGLLARRVAVTVICEALLLIVISRVGLEAIVCNLVLFTIPILAPVLATLLLIRDPLLKIEKTLYRIDVGLKRVERIITSNLVVYTLLTGLSGFRRPSFKLLTSTAQSVNVKRILWALVSFRAANALLLIQLPIYLGKVLGYAPDSMLGVYGLARLVLTLDFLVPAPISGGKTYLVMLVRGMLPLLLLMQSSNVAGTMIALVLGLTLYLNSKIDVALYSMYVDALGRVETTKYLLVSEATGFLSTLVSGVVYAAVGYDGIIIATALLHALGAVLLRT
ncbi:MAG: hypothetical protein QXY82_04950 [Desulfurococcaceae archaeon]